MANKIQTRRGTKAKLPTLSAGEPAFCTDTRELYIGTSSGNVNMGGSMWYKGTAMSGTSTTTGAYSYSDCPQVKVGDTYLNTSNGNIYECTTAGSGTTAKWTYQGSIKGLQGNKGQDAANYVNSYGTSGSWKAVYTNGGGYFENNRFGDDSGTVVLEGMGSTKTKFTFSFSTYYDPIDESQYIWYERGKTIIIKDATVKLGFDNTWVTTGANFVFINCEVMPEYGGDNFAAIYNGSGNITFINSRITQTEHDYYNNTQNDPNTVDSCYSGICTTGNVKIIGGNISVIAGGTTNGFDSNFIYRCNALTMQGVTINTSGNSTGRINLIRNCNKATVNGCYIYLNGTMHSIGHIADTDRTVGGSFTGNYVEYHKTYMHFGVISGNNFYHLATGSSSANQIILQCPTNMTGNTFKGSAAYVDAQSQKVIVDRNMHDNGLTVGSAASGSITTNNIQY